MDALGSVRPTRWGRNRSARVATRALAVAALPLLGLAGCDAALLDPAGPIAGANRTILIDSLGIMLAIVVPTMLATLGVAWWFRAGNRRAHYRPDFAYSGQLELLVWSIPLLTILLLGGVAWYGSHMLDPARPIASRQRPLQVQVVALDWKWLFIYPEFGVATVNELVLPAGRPVQFALTSASVLNTFFIPRLGSMIYTMNGMSTHLHLQADAPGTFHGLSGHYSGAGFSGMNFEARALPAAEFDQWVAQQRAAGGPVLDDAAYRDLSRQSQNVKPFSFREVAPGLYDRITSQELPPGPGPARATAPDAAPEARALQPGSDPVSAMEARR